MDPWSLLGWTREWSDGQKVPYAHSGSNWVGYDDPESIAAKVRDRVSPFRL